MGDIGYGLYLWLVLYCAASALAFWTCSLVGRLDSAALLGIVFIFGLFAIAGVCGIKPWSLRNYRVRFRVKRFRRLLPFCFLIVAVLVATGALLHHPNNYDHLSYRFPRLLHWWSAGHWHWIETTNLRMNYSGLGFELSWYPLFLLTKSDWGAVALNFASFLLLPGQVFRCFRLVGVGRRLSYAWMWALPCGYGFVAQAGSAGNDLFGAFLFLVAFNSAILAFRPTVRYDFLCIAILASALLTAVKLSNAPLLLPVAVVILANSYRVLNWTALPRLLPIGALGLIVSAAPLIAANQLNSGSWTGDPENTDKLRVDSPIAATLGNTLQIGLYTGSAPVNPLASKWNSAWKSIFPTKLAEWLQERYPRFRLDQREIMGEEDAGLGLGLLLLLGCSLLVGFIAGKAAPGSKRPRSVDAPLTVALVMAWAAFAVCLAKLGSESIARLALPYYPILIASILRFVPPPRDSGQLWLLRWAAALSILSALPMLILTPSRPLFPWEWVARQLPEESTFRERFQSVYSTYANRWDAFGPVRARIPSEAAVVGFLSSGDDPEASLWRPFGSRRVVHLMPGDTGGWPDFIVLPSAEIDAHASALQEYASEAFSLELKAAVGPTSWHLLMSPSMSNRRDPNPAEVDTSGVLREP